MPPNLTPPRRDRAAAPPERGTRRRFGARTPAPQIPSRKFTAEFSYSNFKVVGSADAHQLTPPAGDLAMHAFDVVQPLAEIGLALSGLEAATGRTAPDVIT